MYNQSISIVVPTLNEEGSLPTLLRRIDTTLSPLNIRYEVVIVDDHSSDNTIKVAKELQLSYPVMIYEKRGTRGKAHSLLEGFDKCRYGIVAMIDADLQYPPEALADMYRIIQETGTDVVVTRRHDNKTSPIRKLSSFTFNLIFSRMLFGINYDTQSGLKMFKKRVLNHFQMNPSPWSFDQEFIVRSLEHKFKIISHTIPFSERHAGATKVKLFNVTYELAKASLQLRWRTSFGKIREGTQANQRFLKRTLPITMLALVVSSMLFIAPSVSAAPQDSRRTGLIEGIVQQLFGGSNSSSNNTPTEAPSNTLTSPQTTPTAQPTAPTQPTQVAAVPTPAPATTRSTNTQQQSSNRTATTSTTAPATTVAAVDTTLKTQTLAPATNAQNEQNLYKDGYPNYVLSSTSTQKLNGGAKAALIGGGSVLSGLLLYSLYAGLRSRFQYQHA